MATVGVKGLNK